MMSEQNKALERRLIDEVWNKGNFAIVDDLISADYVGHSSSPETETRGPEGYKQFVRMLRSGFPDLQVTVEDQIAEDDRVVSRWRARGTHSGNFFGAPPTGKQGLMTGITVERIANGKAVECWTNSDELGLLQHLGIIPAPARTG